MAPNTPADRVRERMRRWMDVTKIGQRAFAKDLHKTQIWLQKVLVGENHVRLRDLDLVAAAMHTTAAELVRSDDNRYQLELSPTEVQIIERLRRRGDLFAAISTLLDIPAPRTSTERVHKTGRPTRQDVAAAAK